MQEGWQEYRDFLLGTCSAPAFASASRVVVRCVAWRELCPRHRPMVPHARVSQSNPCRSQQLVEQSGRRGVRQLRHDERPHRASRGVGGSLPLAPRSHGKLVRRFRRRQAHHRRRREVQAEDRLLLRLRLGLRRPCGVPGHDRRGRLQPSPAGRLRCPHRIEVGHPRPPSPPRPSPAGVTHGTRTPRPPPPWPARARHPANLSRSTGAWRNGLAKIAATLHDTVLKTVSCSGR